MSKKVSKLNFSLRAMFVLVTLFAIGFGWIYYVRGRNSDALNEFLNQLGPAHVTVTNGDDAKEGWWAGLSGNKSARPRSIRVFGLTNGAAARIRHNKATDRMEELQLIHYAASNPFFAGRTVIGETGEFDPPLNEIHNNGGKPPFDSDCPMFFENWPIKRLVIRDCKLPTSWLDKMKTLTSLEEVVVSGGLCNIEPESFSELPNLKRLVLCHRGVGSAKLEQLQAAMPKVQIDLLGSFETKFQFADQKCLSEHHAENHQEMKELLERINQLMVEAGGTNKAPGPPATEAEIFKLEQTIGVPLPPSLRALVEVSNGWPESPVFYWNGFRSTDQIISDYKERMGYVYKPDEYDFNLLEFDQFANPNAVPFNESVGVYVCRDELCGLDLGGESGPWAYNQKMDLFHVFEWVLLEMTNKKFEVYTPRKEPNTKRITTYLDLDN